jgi:hypothetical protein
MPRRLSDLFGGVLRNRRLRVRRSARRMNMAPHVSSPRCPGQGQSAETILEPGAFDRNSQATEALLEQLLVRQLFPRIFRTWHRHPEVTENGCLDGVIGYRRQQPPGLRGVPSFSARDGFGLKADLLGMTASVGKPDVPRDPDTSVFGTFPT